MLHSQDNLHAGPHAPVSLAAGDITTLLPGTEIDFTHGREPKSRAALEDTPPATANPTLISDPGRSLFATLVQTHHFWGDITRRTLNYDKSIRPWEPESEFAQMAVRLEEWETKLPHDHQWSPYLLKVYKQERQELVSRFAVRVGNAEPQLITRIIQAYLGVTNTTRLCNIVIRKAYLHEQVAPSSP